MTNDDFPRAVGAPSPPFAVFAGEQPGTIDASLALSKRKALLIRYPESLIRG